MTGRGLCLQSRRHPGGLGKPDLRHLTPTASEKRRKKVEREAEKDLPLKGTDRCRRWGC